MLVSLRSSVTRLSLPFVKARVTKESKSILSSFKKIPVGLKVPFVSISMMTEDDDESPFCNLLLILVDEDATDCPTTLTPSNSMGGLLARSMAPSHSSALSSNTVISCSSMDLPATGVITTSIIDSILTGALDGVVEGVAEGEIIGAPVGCVEGSATGVFVGAAVVGAAVHNPQVMGH